MAAPIDSYKSVWWRFTRYELRDGYIRPAPDAELEEYDPWIAYRESWEYDPDSSIPYAEKRKQNPPYQSLLALLEEIHIRPGGKLTDESAERLLAWCSQHGLLGILPQRVVMVAFASRWLPLQTTEEEIRGQIAQPTTSTELYIKQPRFFRSNSYQRHLGGYLRGWYPTPKVSVEAGKGHQFGELSEEKPSEPSVLIQRMYPHPHGGFPSTRLTPAYLQEPLGKTWARFFPDVREEEAETYFYPVPLSDAFWRIYAESVEDFLAGAVILRDALTGINNPTDVHKWDYGIDLLNNLVSSASMMLVPSEDGSFRQEWRTPSLLSCFAVMMLQDLTQQRRVLSCDNCKRPFVTEAYQARYCSDKCRRTAQKRRYRKRLKEGSGDDQRKPERAKGRKRASREE